MSTPRLSHTVSAKNTIDPKTAVKKGYPLLAECGLVWVPTTTDVTGVPECPECHKPKGVYQRRAEPHYVYRHYDEDDRLVYVGCTINPIARTAAHRTNSWWFDQVARTRLTVFPDRNYALAVESRAIAEEHPRFNVKGRWDHRALWTADDYADYYTALAGTSPATGYKARQLEKVADEAKRRYSIELGAEESA